MKQKRRVLVINDDAADCALIGRTLEPHGIEVIAHHDAQTGYEAAAALLPDLVFIKLLLPDTNGLKVSKAIHSLGSLRHVPLVVIVSEAGELDPKYTTTIGIVDILVKPLRSSEIIAKTVALLGEEALMDVGDTAAEWVQDEEEVYPVDEDESMVSARGIDKEDFGMPPAYEQETESAAEHVKEGEYGRPSVPEHRTLYEEIEQDLFSGISARPKRDVTEPREEDGRTPSPAVNESEEDRTADFDSPDEPSASPVRRAVGVVAAVIAGIAVGVGGYLFFTAGTPKPPAQKQIKEVLPGPVALPQPAPATPPAQPGAIPEIPVKEEPMSVGKSSQKEPTPQEPVSKSEKAPEAGPAVSPGTQMKAPSASGRTNGMYIVQAGVFEKKENADALAEKITGMGVTASVTKIEGTGTKIVYRVIAGTFATRAEADQASENFKKKGITTIVRKK
jgi:CheY-like chemotaxis protein